MESEASWATLATPVGVKGLPYVAGFRDVRTLKEGSRRDVITGTIYRHSDGRERRDFDGKEAVLLDADLGSMTTLDPSTMKADRLLLDVRAKPIMMSLSWRFKGIGPNILDLRAESLARSFRQEENVVGLRCNQYLRETKARGLRTVLWISTDFQILVKIHSTNSEEIYDWCLTDVELREPDQSLWLVPQGYKVSDYIESD
jgi:hypothetical protein